MTLNVCRDLRLSRELAEQLSPWWDHGRRKTCTHEGAAVAVVDFVDESVGNLEHSLSCCVAVSAYGPKF